MNIPLGSECLFWMPCQLQCLIWSVSIGINLSQFLCQGTEVLPHLQRLPAQFKMSLSPKVAALLQKIHSQVILVSPPQKKTTNGIYSLSCVLGHFGPPAVPSCDISAGSSFTCMEHLACTPSKSKTQHHSVPLSGPSILTSPPVTRGVFWISLHLKPPQLPTFHHFTCL